MEFKVGDWVRVTDQRFAPSRPANLLYKVVDTFQIPTYGCYVYFNLQYHYYPMTKNDTEIVVSKDLSKIERLIYNID